MCLYIALYSILLYIVNTHTEIGSSNGKNPAPSMSCVMVGGIVLSGLHPLCGSFYINGVLLQVSRERGPAQYQLLCLGFSCKHCSLSYWVTSVEKCTFTQSYADVLKALLTPLRNVYSAVYNHLVLQCKALFYPPLGKGKHGWGLIQDRGLMWQCVMMFDISILRHSKVSHTEIIRFSRC